MEVVQGVAGAVRGSGARSETDRSRMAALAVGRKSLRAATSVEEVIESVRAVPTLGPDHPDVGTDLNNLAVLYRVQGRYPDAEPLMKRALAIDEKALGPDHPDVGTDLNNLALLYRVQGRYPDAEPLMAELYLDQSRSAEAEPLMKRALAFAEKTLGPDGRSTRMRR
jgi:tetratricopeptide (TPR) repeat protein